MFFQGQPNFFNFTTRILVGISTPDLLDDPRLSRLALIFTLAAMTCTDSQRQYKQSLTAVSEEAGRADIELIMPASKTNDPNGMINAVKRLANLANAPVHFQCNHFCGIALPFEPPVPLKVAYVSGTTGLNPLVNDPFARKVVSSSLRPQQFRVGYSVEFGELAL